MEHLIENHETQEVCEYSESSYLNYSMYVIINRSLPHIADGLKPVQRRIIYSMHELNLNSSAKYKKSARTVGDTLGKYHPHGDTACYEAMVILAQPFSTLHPLVDGQGNWGSVDDPKSYAAMRYTESKMTPYSELLLKDIKRGTIDWGNNFDGTMKEPTLLPSQLPNILINGTTGVAVGMATDVPPHNLEEVIKATIAYLKNKKITDNELLSFIVCPDLPNGGEIINTRKEILDTYLTGRGKLHVRASVEFQDDGIYINSVPFRQDLASIVADIDRVIKEKKLPVTSMKDFADKKTPVKLFLGVKGEKAQQLVINTLFASTALQSTLKVNLNMIGLDGKPEVKSLPNIIREWCVFRQDIFERKTRFRLDEICAKLHILEGLLVAFKNIDEVIRIIREEDEPKEALMNAFSLSEIQTKAILELKLRQLAKLEEMSILEDKKALEKEKDEIDTLLADDKLIRKAVINEIESSAKSHFKPRKTNNIVREAVSLDTLNDKKINNDPCTVVLSKNNWIRTIKDHDVDFSSLSFKSGDGYLAHLSTKYNLPAIVMGDKGRFFGIPCHTIMNGKSMGEPISARIKFKDGEQLHSLLPFNENARALLVTEKGNGFQVPISTLDSRNKAGKQVLVLTENDKPLPPCVITEEKELAIVTEQGRLLIIPIDEINTSNKSQGVRLADIKSSDFDAGNDRIRAVLPLSGEEGFSVYVGGRKHNVKVDELDYYRCKRARRGVFFKKGKAGLSLFKLGDPSTPVNTQFELM